MVMWRRRFLRTHLRQGESKLFWEYLLIQKMHYIKSPYNPELVTLSFWTMLHLLGCPRSKQILKLQCLDQNMLRWRLEWKHSGDCDTSCAWWEYQYRDSRWFMWKICQLFTTRSGQSPYWRKIRIQFVTMRLGHLWQWQKVWWGMCHQWTTRQTFVRNLFQVEQSGSTLLVICCMTYMISNVLGNVFINTNLRMDIYGCIFLRGLKTSYRVWNRTLGRDIPRGEYLTYAY